MQHDSTTKKPSSKKMKDGGFQAFDFLGSINQEYMIGILYQYNQILGAT